VVRSSRVRRVVQPPWSAEAVVEQREASPFHGRTILVVEDEIELGDQLRRLLEHLGARVWIARDGLDGLEQLASLPADAVLCDLALPVMDGLEFARRLRQNPRFRRTLLVAVTGRQDQEDFLRSWDAGFDAHLVKPLTMEMLQALARRLSTRCAGPRQSGA
jgi:CheY-like chemotaxis protein